jgi:hypothetical protein
MDIFTDDKISAWHIYFMHLLERKIIYGKEHMQM